MSGCVVQRCANATGVQTVPSSATNEHIPISRLGTCGTARKASLAAPSASQFFRASQGHGAPKMWGVPPHRGCFVGSSAG
eukprot:13463008-Alexandrium_andersonii.AAC.1